MFSVGFRGGNISCAVAFATALCKVKNKTMESTAKRLFKRLVLSCAMMLTAAVAHGEDEVLYWMVTDGATVDNQGILYFLQDYVVDEDNWNAARVRVSGGGYSSPFYLAVYFGNGDFEDGTYGVELFDNGSGYWGAGVPTGNQSPFGRELLEECIFTMELGHNSWDALSGEVSWVTLAESDSLAYAALQEYVYQRFDLNPPTAGIWTPTEFHAVPEPTVAMLYLLGGAFLVLRRKREKV